MAVVVEALDGRVRDRAVPLPGNCLPANRELDGFDLAVRPAGIRLGPPVLDPVGLTDHVEAHWPRIDGVRVPGLLGELDAPRHCFSDQWRSNGSIGQ